MALDPALQEKINQFRLRAAESARKERESYARASDELGLDVKHRSENLRLLRTYFWTTQETIAELLCISQPKFSQYERGEVSIPDSSARSIEKHLGVPKYWLDRKNFGIFLSDAEFLILKELRSCSPEAIAALTKAISLLKAKD